MKKTFYLLTLAVFFLQSCSSSDDNQTESTTLILCKKKVETDPQGTFTTNYTYNGNKITRANLVVNYNNGSSGEAIANYTYDGDLISQVEILINNALVEKQIYNYNQNNQLISFTQLDYLDETGDKMVYTHNQNGTITSIEYSGDLINQNTVESNNLISFLNGEIISLVENYGGTTRTITYSYDNKNSPFKNVLGFDKISFAVVGTFKSEINHNLIQITRVQNGAPTSTTNIEHTYNSNNFPVTSAETSNGFTDYTYEYFY
jgi:hypothetical protein